MRTDPRAPGGVMSGIGASTGLAVLLACLVLLTLLGHKALTNWDEAIYAEVSREMLSTGWLVPHWNGHVWLEKPPLMLWITGTFFKLFGVTEFWARAGSALSGVAIVGVLHRWVARRYGLVAAWVGTVALLTTTGFLHVCRVGEMDVLLSLGCVTALIGLAAVGAERPLGWLGFWVGFAIAAMTKGGAGIVLPLTAVILAVVERWTWPRFRREFWLGMAVFAGLVGPWHLLMWHRYGASFAREYFGYHVLARAAHPIEGHITPWWYYLWVVFVSAMPWVMVAPLALWTGWRRRELRAWAVFALVVLCFFSVVRTRLPHYVAPLYPAMALMTGVYLAEQIKEQAARHRGGASRWAFAIAAATLCGISVLVTGPGRRNLHRARTFGGAAPPDEKEPVALVLATGGQMAQARGPLLVWWRDPQRAIASCVFYARRPVRAVSLGASVDGPEVDRYRGSFENIETLGPGARMILIDRDFVAMLPAAFSYRAIKTGRTMEIGMIRRLQPGQEGSGDPLEETNNAHGGGF